MSCIKLRIQQDTLYSQWITHWKIFFCTYDAYAMYAFYNKWILWTGTFMGCVLEKGTGNMFCLVSSQWCWLSIIGTEFHYVMFGWCLVCCDCVCDYWFDFSMTVTSHWFVTHIVTQFCEYQSACKRTCAFLQQDMTAHTANIVFGDGARGGGLQPRDPHDLNQCECSLCSMIRDRVCGNFTTVKWSRKEQGENLPGCGVLNVTGIILCGMNGCSVTCDISLSLTEQFPPLSVNMVHKNHILSAVHWAKASNMFSKWVLGQYNRYSDLLQVW